MNDYNGTTNETRVWVAGGNLAGYLPEMSPFFTLDIEEARRFLIEELESVADADYENTDLGDEIASIQQDINLTNSADFWHVGDEAYWIEETTLGVALYDTPKDPTEFDCVEDAIDYLNQSA